MHELVVEAKRITEEHKAGRRADAEEHAQQGKEMQDEVWCREPNPNPTTLASNPNTRPEPES